MAFGALKNGISDRGMIYDIRKDRPSSLADLVDRIRVGIEAKDAIK